MHYYEALKLWEFCGNFALYCSFPRLNLAHVERRGGGRGGGQLIVKLQMLQLVLHIQ